MILLNYWYKWAGGVPYNMTSYYRHTVMLLAGEQQSGANIICCLVPDLAVTLVDVISVEVADECKTVVFRRLQEELVLAEGVVARGRKSHLTGLMFSVDINVDDGTELWAAVYTSLFKSPWQQALLVFVIKVPNIFFHRTTKYKIKFTRSNVTPFI